jgi:hypothetical protein
MPGGQGGRTPVAGNGAVRAAHLRAEVVASTQSRKCLSCVAGSTRTGPFPDGKPERTIAAPPQRSVSSAALAVWAPGSLRCPAGPAWRRARAPQDFPSTSPIAARPAFHHFLADAERGALAWLPVESLSQSAQQADAMRPILGNWFLAGTNGSEERLEPRPACTGSAIWRSSTGTSIHRWSSTRWDAGRQLAAVVSAWQHPDAASVGEANGAPASSPRSIGCG